MSARSRLPTQTRALYNERNVKGRAKPRIVVIYNRDFEGAEADPENKAREDIKLVADDVLRVLTDAGYRTAEVGVTGDALTAIHEIKALAPAAVFNLCESISGDNRFEALMPMLLELEGLAYTGTGPFGLSLALRKERAKEVLRARGVPVARGLMLEKPDVSAVALQYPLIVKPAREDASVGISSASVVRDPAALAARVRHVIEHYRQPALVEEFIDGREINVSLLGRVDDQPQVLPLFEIDFSDMPADRPKIVSFEGKWIEDSAEYHGTRPVRCQGLSDETTARVAAAAVAAFQAMDLRDYGRVDIRLTADGVPYVIDVNPNCDLSAEAGGFARAAKAGGLSYKDVILRLLELALSRRPDADTIPLPRRPRSADPADRPGNGESVPARRGVLRAGAPRGGARPA